MLLRTFLQRAQTQTRFKVPWNCLAGRLLRCGGVELRQRAGSQTNQFCTHSALRHEETNKLANLNCWLFLEHTNVVPLPHPPRYSNVEFPGWQWLGGIEIKWQIGNANFPCCTYILQKLYKPPHFTIVSCLPLVVMPRKSYLQESQACGFLFINRLTLTRLFCSRWTSITKPQTLCTSGKQIITRKRRLKSYLYITRTVGKRKLTAYVHSWGINLTYSTAHTSRFATHPRIGSIGTARGKQLTSQISSVCKIRRI